MKIVTDSGTDTKCLDTEGYEIHEIPLQVNLAGKTYKDGKGIKLDEFYPLLEKSEDLPTTSQPAPGEFADLYKKLAKEDKDILSIHISSGLSGTVNSAILGAEMVKDEANVTVIDTKTLSAAAGWQVLAAAKAVAQGWSKEQIIEKLQKIAESTKTIYTLKDLKFLIHGGRISHIKGLVASLLNIKPLIGVNNEKGNYEQLGQSRSFKNALNGLVKIIVNHVPAKEEIIAQVVHAANFEGAAILKEKVTEAVKAIWLPTGQTSLVLGAHTGSSLVGIGFAPASVLSGIE